ncbi:MAG: SDR family oxidoreductase [Propionibacteriales bacterium]|nr:SDR family oxidoreductase [Propionibacteriales bacterium]
MADKTRRVALVTGASRGLGAAIAERLGTDGYAVAVNYARSEQGARAVVDRIGAAGGRAAAFRADVTDESGVTALVEAVRGELGPVDTLVLNATGPQPTTAAADLDWQVLLDQLSFFVKSPVLLLAAVLPDMVAAGRGRVIHIGSDVIERLPIGNSAYAAAKYAQLGLARIWAKELAPLGITVNTVAPGWVPVERHAAADPALLQRYVDGVPAGRFGTPEEIAAAVSFLAGDDSAFVVGARLTVNGGSTVG